MVAVDDSALFGRRLAPRLDPLVAGIPTVAIALVLGAILARDFSENGFRLGSQFAWRYASLVFFAALVAEPACRMASHFFAHFQTPEKIGPRLIWGFCASYGVYLLSIFLPNALHPSLGATMMVLFGGGVVLVMALTAVPLRGLHGIRWEKARRALSGTAMVYFWLCYCVMALARISGPHRPDAFYDISLSLMLVGLLVRYANRWFPEQPPQPDPKVSNLRHSSVSN